MNGVIFFKTNDLGLIKEFYTKDIGCELWMEQADCLILKAGDQLIGFCDRGEVDSAGMITFFFDTKDEVDKAYLKYKDLASEPPVDNVKYNIYQFFAKDPEGRILEFQHFNDPVTDYLAGDQLLVQRRSIRGFSDKPVRSTDLDKVFGLCRYAPTSKNSQAYYFKLINEPELLKKLSEIRGHSSRPIAAANTGVGICVDTNQTSRAIADGNIAAYHFTLAAAYYGLGTCWIADMNRDTVKELIGIPQDHLVATVTPIGYLEERNNPIPFRKDAKEFIK